MHACVAASLTGDAGDNFYVIDEGTFDVFITKADVETKVGEMLYISEWSRNTNEGEHSEVSRL